MNQIIVNNIAALIATLQDLNKNDLVLKRKDVLLDLGRLGCYRQCKNDPLTAI